jgi:hypothetical protein
MVLTVQDLLNRHEAGLKNFQPIPTFAEIQAQGADMPRIAIISCADPRCTPEHIFGLKGAGRSTCLYRTATSWKLMDMTRSSST